MGNFSPESDMVIFIGNQLSDRVQILDKAVCISFRLDSLSYEEIV